MMRGRSKIREAIVDRVERTAEPTAAGRRTLAYNHVRIAVLGGAEDRPAMAAALEDIDAALRARLAELRCPVPPGFDVEVEFIDAADPAWRPAQRFALDFETRVVSRAPGRRTTAPGLRITVLRGTTTQPVYDLDQTDIRIGRSATPTDHTGRPRQNHIVFAEDDDEHSHTVGRAHASIHYDAARREYRLFDDGSHNGTRIVRQGAVLTLTARNPVGTTLLSGDEVQFGTAAVTLEIGCRVQSRVRRGAMWRRHSRSAGQPMTIVDPSPCRRNRHAGEAEPNLSKATPTSPRAECSRAGQTRDRGSPPPLPGHWRMSSALTLALRGSATSRAEVCPCGDNHADNSTALRRAAPIAAFLTRHFTFF